MRRFALLAAVALALPACSTVERLNPFAEKKPPPLPGTRIPVLSADSSVQADPLIASKPIVLPRPTANREWPQSGGYPSHAMHHLALAPAPAVAWSTSIGAGSYTGGFFQGIGLGADDRRLVAQPVVGDGRVYTMSARGEVRAYGADGGGQVWSVTVLPRDEREGDLGGGLGFSQGRLFVATGGGEVLALEAATGKEVWRKPAPAPIRGAPAISGGRVLVITTENELVAFDAKDGGRLWNFVGVAEATGILGAANAAIDGGVVVVPLSSGELIALRIENGRQLWAERLAAARQINPITNIADITARPVIDRGMVLAVSNAGRLAALDIRTGRRLWDVDVGALQTPWVAGDWVFALTNDGQLMALERSSGRVRWSLALNALAPEREQRRGVVWVGPVLAGDRLIVAGSYGEALAVSPYTGRPIGTIRTNEGVFIQPVVANGTLYLLDDGGRLTALR